MLEIPQWQNLRVSDNKIGKDPLSMRRVFLLQTSEAYPGCVELFLARKSKRIQIVVSL